TASLAENRIASVEVSTGRVTLSNIPGAARSLVQFTIAPHGRSMIAGGELSNTMLFWDPSTVPLAVVREQPVGAKPWDPVFSRDGRRIYVSLLVDNAVAEIDAATGQVLRRFTERLAQPDGVIM